jgi:hypothetical protein
VVDSLLDRVQLTGFRCKDKAVQAALDEWWDAQDMAADAEEIAKAVSVCGEGFMLAELDEAGSPRTFENAPHLCAVLYREDDPKTPDLAAKWWEEGGVTHLTLYYPDRLLHFSAQSKRNEISSAAAFVPDSDLPDEPNTLGGIPVFHYRRDRRSSSRLTNVIPLNNAINKLFADMMVAAEFGAFKKRYIISSADVTDGATNLKGGANEVAMIPGGEGGAEGGQDTSVGQFEATELANFIAGLDHIALRIAILSHTPKHYLLQQGDVSGEALLAGEAGLVRDAGKYIARLSVTWKHAAAFVMNLAGHKVSPDDIECVWEDEHTVQPYTESLIDVNERKAGVPLDTLLRRKGWSKDEIKQLHDDEAAEQARGNTLADSLLADAQKQFDQGGNPSPYPSPGAPSPSTTPPATDVPPTQAPKAKRGRK